ncbi:TetR/AcrR family transcriptional regulator [Psychromicrobium xiongbiense]|uniref:TetR/AcrR family transcriptional regulator n=1 Tax=Psychromicrobium xiongbiense TaxID=3051184 RepID=UPI0025539562|nr:TetR/AcrR family transcriptional regulator [Psychromicrobium sp. YIM S02556]
MVTAREQLKHATQQRVIAAAGQLFDQRGFAETTVRDIAEASNVSTGSVMAVGDKNTLLIRVFDTMIAAEHAQRRGTKVSSTAVDGHTCVDRLTSLTQPFVALFTESPELARSYASILVSGTHTSLLFADLAAQLVEEFRAAVTLHGCTSEGDAPATASALYFAYVGTLFTWSARGPADPSELTASLRTTFTAICTCKE